MFLLMDCLPIARVRRTFILFADVSLLTTVILLGYTGQLSLYYVCIYNVQYIYVYYYAFTVFILFADVSLLTTVVIPGYTGRF